MGITGEALQRMEKRASDFSDGTQTDNPTAHQLVLHVYALAREVRRLGPEPPMEPECTSCAEEAAGAVGVHRGECPESRRSCGHHCNHSWSQERCCWCGAEFGDDSEAAR